MLLLARGWLRALAVLATPARATEQRRSPWGPLVIPRLRFAAAGLPTPHGDRRARDPARSGAMASPPSGRNHPRPPGTRLACPRRLALPGRMTFRSLTSRLGRRAFNPPVPRVANFSGARGYRTREPRWGDGGAASRERRGATTRIALSGHGRRSVRPQAAGAAKAARLATRGSGKKQKRHAVKENYGREPAGHDKSEAKVSRNYGVVGRSP
jgi:hypothetical protein